MKYNLLLNNRAFNAIKNNTKKIEIRVTTDKNRIDYANIKKDDYIEFTNQEGEKINCIVKENVWYENVKKLLEIEGTRFTLSSTDNINEGIQSINSFNGYKEGMEKNGVYAIHIEYVPSVSIVEMKLYNENYNYIKNGSKRIEIRLNDEKRKNICIGDHIEFLNVNTYEKMLVKVIGLLNYNKIEQLVNDFEMGILLDKNKSKIDLIEMFNKIYSKEKQEKYNILGIRFEIIDK